MEGRGSYLLAQGSRRRPRVIKVYFSSQRQEADQISICRVTAGGRPGAEGGEAVSSRGMQQQVRGDKVKNISPTAQLLFLRFSVMSLGQRKGGAGNFGEREKGGWVRERRVAGREGEMVGM